MTRHQLPLLAIIVLTFTLLATSAKAQLIQFSWTDDQGQLGEFTLDTALGFSPSSIIDFSYILSDGTPTPPGFQVNSFIGFNTDTAWDINTGSEGVTFLFNTPISDPFPNDPQIYLGAFQSGNFITDNDTRTWNSISVTSVPEPFCGLPLLLALPLTFLRRNRS